MPTPAYEVHVIGDIESKEDCLRGLIHSLLTHFADQTNLILDVISTEFKINKEELSYVIRDNPEINQFLKQKLSVLECPQPVRTKSGKKIIIIHKK